MSILCEGLLPWAKVPCYRGNSGALPPAKPQNPLKDTFIFFRKYGIICSMGHRRLAFLFVVVFYAYTAGAQEAKPLIQLNPFSIEGIGTEESRLIVSLVQSYLSDIGQVVGHAAPNSSGNYPADFSISGAIRMEPDGHIFMLEITNVKTGEVHTVSSVYKNSGEIALKTRSVLESAFAAGGMEPEKKTFSRPEQINESVVIGTWKGEAGIEMIRLMQGGRGLAIFSSGAQMVLAYIIDGNTLKIWQTSPNSERYYYPLPLDAARQLALDAEPINWELSMFQGGTTLGGIRVSTAARMSGGRVTGTLPGGDVREVTWTKTH